MAWNLAGQIIVKNPTANIDGLYGPWSSVEEALEKTKGKRKPGRTVGILENNDIVEYWFRDGVEDDNLIIKGNIYVGDEAPGNTDAIWLDTSTTIGPNTSEINNPIILSIQRALVELEKRVSALTLLRTNGVISGGVTDSTLNEMSTISDPVAPSILGDEDDEPATDYPDYASESSKTINHMSVKYGTFTEMKANTRNFVDAEMCWCTDRLKMYVYWKGAFYPMGSGTSSGGEITDDDMTNAELQNYLNGLTSIGFTSVSDSSKTYTVKINEYGNLVVYDSNNDEVQSIPTVRGLYFGSIYFGSLFINSFYLGGADNNEHSYLPCSHNFVELSNISDEDINLNGLYLMYYNESAWEKLPLWGICPAHSTFLIRGAQCSVMDVNTTKIKVKTFDMEWVDSQGDLIKFRSGTGAKASFYLCWGDTSGNIYHRDGDTVENDSLYPDPGTSLSNIALNDMTQVAKGYIDLVGVNSSFFEKKVFNPGTLNENMLFVRWYSLDPVSQSNPKTVDKRSEPKYWKYIDLRGNLIDNIEDFTPKASFEHKTHANDKHKFSADEPNTLTCNFGIQASEAEDCDKIRYTIVQAEHTENSVNPYAFEVRRYYNKTDYTVEDKYSIDGATVVNNTPTSYNTVNTYEIIKIDSNNINNVPAKEFNNEYEIGDYYVHIQYTTTPVSAGNTTTTHFYRRLTNGGATRCFTWTSVDYYDEYLWYRKIKDAEGNDIQDSKLYRIESFKSGVNYQQNANKYYRIPKCIQKGYSKYFERTRWETYYGLAVTTHKAMVSDLTAGVYEYYVGRADKNGNVTSYKSKTRQFTVRTYDKCKDFDFIQITDQQGANWEEYQVWTMSAMMIDRDERGVSRIKTETVFETQYDDNGNTLYAHAKSNKEDIMIPYNEATDIEKRQAEYEKTINKNKIVDEETVESEDTADWTVPKLTSDELVKGIEKQVEVGSTKDFDFFLNTGDIVYNGSRPNEWIDYYEGYKYVDDKEENLTIGNNDLAPVSMTELGNGSERPHKINHVVADLFYTNEIDVDNPQVFKGKSIIVTKTSTGGIEISKGGEDVYYKVPSLYSFNYGPWHFVSLNSEIRTGVTVTSEYGTLTGEFGVWDENRVTEWTVSENGTRTPVYVEEDGKLVPKTNDKASLIYDYIESWMIQDLMLWKKMKTPKDPATGENFAAHDFTDKWTTEDSSKTYREYYRYVPQDCDKCIVYTHEMPFTITASSTYGEYTSKENTDLIYREKSKANLNLHHDFEFQKLFKLWGIKCVLGGHKHTCSISYPLYDAPKEYDILNSSNSSTDELRNSLMQHMTGGDTFIPVTQMLIPASGEIPEETTRRLKKYLDYTSQTLTVDANSYPVGVGDIYNNTDRDITIDYNNKTLTIQAHNKYTVDTSGKPTCRLELVTKITAPTYVMCQATGYKNKSNSDTAANIYNGWLKHFVAEGGDDQAYPFYTRMSLSAKENKIQADMYRVTGLYTPSSKAGYWNANNQLVGNTLDEARANRLAAMEKQLWGSSTIILNESES